MKSNLLWKNDCLTIIEEIMKSALKIELSNHTSFQQRFYHFLSSVIEHNFELLANNSCQKNWDLLFAFLLKGINDLNFEICIFSLDILLKFLQVKRKKNYIIYSKFIFRKAKRQISLSQTIFYFKILVTFSL